MSMGVNQFFGFLAAGAAIVYLSFGIPLQILKNYRNKSVKGISLPFVIFMCVSLTLWIAYAWTKDPVDWFILVSNLPGFVFSMILISQFYIYKE